MACISKISNAITYDCDSGATGIISALLINKEDIESFTVTDSSVTAINLKRSMGQSVFKIDTVKRALVMSEALKINEGAPNAFTHSANLTLTNNMAGGGSGALLNTVVNPSTNGSFVILALTPMAGAAGGKAPRVYGLYYGMSATAVDKSTHENGAWYTISMATPERVLGEDALSVTSALYDSLYGSAAG